jgi:calpain-15
VRLFESGAYTTVKVKNRFPVNISKVPFYAKPIDGDISVMLLEKAYAQMYGGWDNIHLGFNCDALRDLSGAPT